MPFCFSVNLLCFFLINKTIIINNISQQSLRSVIDKLSYDGYDITKIYVLVVLVLILKL